jgi:hypothetical protein
VIGASYLIGGELIFLVAIFAARHTLPWFAGGVASLAGLAGSLLTL